MNRAYILLMLAMFCVVHAFFMKKNPNGICSCTTLAVIVLTGMLCINNDCYNLREDSIAFLDAESGKNSTIMAEGIVCDFPDHDSAKIRFTIEATKIVARDTFFVSDRIVVTIRIRESDSEVSEIAPGDHLIMTGKLTEPPGSRNPGEFDYRNYLFLKDKYRLLSVYGVSNVRVLSENNLDAFTQHIVVPSREYAINSIDRFVSGDEGKYLKGLVAGDRSDISEDVKKAFMDAGVTHLIAVSGLNVAYLILSLSMLCSLLRLNKLVTLSLICFFLFFYTMLTGSTASIIRASIMGGLVLASSRLQRSHQFYNLLGVSCIVILFIDSRFLFDAGFILSFAATYSMVWIYSRFESLMNIRTASKNGKRDKALFYLLTAFLTTFAAQAGTLPVTAQYFGKISIVSFFVNLIAVPLANLSLAIGFLQILLSLMSTTLASLAAETNQALLSGQLAVIEISASLPMASVYVRTLVIAEILIIYFLMIHIFSAVSLRVMAIRLIFAATLFATLASSGLRSTDDLRIYFLDVGQGDCAVILTPEGRCIVVDCGNSAGGYDSGERTLVPFLRRNGIDFVDLLILTHNHLDHIGGASYLIENIKTGMIIYSADGSDEGIADDLLENSGRMGIECKPAVNGEFTASFGQVRLYFLYPFAEEFTHHVNKTENLNNSSVVFLLKYNEAEFLFTGDIEKEAESEIAKTYGGLLRCDILKSPHHGSITSSTSELLALSRPDAAVISCGAFNKFGHPSQEVIGRSEYIGTRIFRTDRAGGITAVTNGYDITIKGSY